MFKRNRERVNVYREIFPGGSDSFQLEDIVEETGRVGKKISVNHRNPVQDIILRSLNSYLFNNAGGLSDFHLMKDVVNRNCDSFEEEIHSQVPVPLYWGLVGTMTGILIGIGFLVISGGLDELLDSGNGMNTSNAASGIKTLMGGIAMAMISSIVGIFLTTWGAGLLRDAKFNVEKNKNEFLSWIQAELLPNLSSDFSGAAIKMSTNLVEFNKTFESNTQGLKATFTIIRDSYQDLSKILTLLNEMKVVEIAAANVDVYEKLKNSSKEIGKFNNYLMTVNEYISRINSLNEKLDAYETRTHAIEDMGIFFKSEIEQIEQRKGAISRSVGNIDAVLTESMEKLRNNSETNLDNYKKYSVEQNQSFEKVLREQTDNIIKQLDIQDNVLKKKTSELDEVVKEIHNLSSIKSSINNLSSTTAEQNRKLDKLINSIHSLANVKTGGMNMIPLSKWVRFGLVGLSIICCITCFSILISLFIN